MEYSGLQYLLPQHYPVSIFTNLVNLPLAQREIWNLVN